MAGNLTAMIAAAFSGGAAPPVTTDPYFEYTTLLLPGNGTNGAQNNTFLDGSTNNFTITRNGNTTQGTFSPFSQTGWGNYFGGSAALTAGSASDWAFMSNTTALWSVEMWVYPTTSGSQTVFLDTNAGASASIGVNIYKTTSNAVGIIITRGVSGSVVINSSSTGTLTTNAWNYVLITYDQSLASGNLNIYINGGSAETFNKTANTPSSSNPTYTLNIGRAASAIEYFTGYLSNIRISNVIRSSTVPTSPLASDGNTKLLTCQSNRFIDNSSNNFTITRNGDTSVVAFSPFNPSASWSAATYGGSGYFDGNTDYLTVPQSAGALDLGSGQFCVDFWWYPTSATTGQYPFIGDSTGNWYVGYESSNIVLGRRATTADVSTTGFTLVANTWQHIVFTRQSTSTNDTRIFVNGVLRGIGTTSQNYTITTTLNIGGLTGGYVTGYLSSTNLVKGSVPAAYQTSSTTTGTQIFTPPTSPSTSVTGTQLLLNYTNAGIYDATSKNDLETVGDAQISTAQSKWGGSSMAFDGTTDYLLTNVASSDLYSFGLGDWTVEFWVRFNNTTGDGCIFDTRNATDTLNVTILRSTTTILFQTGGSTRITSGTITSNVWYHIAVARSGTSTKMFIDGTQAGSTYTDTTSYTAGANRPIIGAVSLSGFVGISSLNGYLQDLRVTKGYARYVTGTGANAGKMVFNGTNNLALPTAAFPTL